MSGHSKWAKIHRGKAVEDAKRGAIFTKLGNQIAIAARKGTDPELNSSLAMAIEKAKAANMPISNINRAIDRVKDKSAAALEEVTYEAYGPGGVGIIIECATDNRNRTFPDVRTAATKNGGSMAEARSVAFQFARKGVIEVEASGEEALLTVLDAGAEDAKEENGQLIVYTDLKDLNRVRESINQAGLKIKAAELEYVPNNLVEIKESDTAQKLTKLLDDLDSLDDVTNIFHNADL